MQEEIEKEEVIFTGIKHAILVKGKAYKIFEKFESGGVRVYTGTGFAGIPTGDFKTIEK
jgi:hypothetical protein